MDKYTKILIILTVVTGIIMVLGDLAYTNYLASGNRLRITLKATDR